MSASSRPTGLAILGSTGSIGTQTLDVVTTHPNDFRVVALSAGSNASLLNEQVARFSPAIVVTGDAHAATLVHGARSGEAALIEAVTHPDVDIVVVASSGHAAIVPTIEAIKAGKTIALANKETIVCAGALIMPLARELGVEIRPVDSEHSAIWQSLGGSHHADIARLILTASGGPFREATREQLASVTVEQALAHPTWNMGGKVTIDSATMMNKGLELIEAHWLFDVPIDQIDILVHPESIIHSLVEFADGSQIAQLSLPDMRLPIQYALTWPRHLTSRCRRLSLAELGTLRFFAADPVRFPALQLARESATAGQSYPAVLSAADEIAVAAFLKGALSFVGITEVVEQALQQHTPVAIDCVEAVLEIDRTTRAAAERIIAAR